MTRETGRVYLVGAGCGGADWLTLRGKALLEGCDCVVYDALIAPELLSFAPEWAERIPVGKRSGRHSMTQEEINGVLIRQARMGRTVVRLKGGDPYVFGRGGEEALALTAAGIFWEEVPGITSAVAIPAWAGIPVTHRDLSRSVHIITAHTTGTDTTLPEDLDTLARLNGTLVFLMGLSALPRLAQHLMAAGKSADTPAAVISGGNSPNPGAVHSTLSRMVEDTERAGLCPPAVIVIGGTAGLELKPEGALPLSGVTVGLTGTRTFADRLKRELERAGAETYPVCRTRCVVRREIPGLDALKEQAPRWVVFTGANGVELFFEELRRRSIDLRRLMNCRFAVIGKATAQTLEQRGFYADLCPEEYTGDGLAQALCRAVLPGEDVAVFRSGQGDPRMVEVLRAHGIAVSDCPIYDLVCDEAVSERIVNEPVRLDYLVFGSAGGVENYFRTVGALPHGAVCVTIGPTTEAALERIYGIRGLRAEGISCGGIVNTLCRNRSEK